MENRLPVDDEQPEEIIMEGDCPACGKGWIQQDREPDIPNLGYFECVICGFGMWVEI